ncbi:MAG TPA: hypothetical protein VLG92_00190 [Candidatus Saccharimonadia bacterium]|nr:hypothetical protein [Candidatus Saccharimonadia bacterium]
MPFNDRINGVEQSTKALLDAALDLPKYVLPMYEFAAQTGPNAIMVCDQDARPIGVALGAIDIYMGAVPAIADRLFYRRISKRVPMDELVEHLSDPLESLRDQGDLQRLMVVDDYVSRSAGTCHTFRRACNRLRVRVPIDWVTLAGRGTALNVTPNLGPTAAAPWRDRPDVLGVSYEGTRLTQAPTPLSEMFYATIRQGVRNLFEHTLPE